MVEQGMREHFKTLTEEDITNSVHLFGLDFDNDSMNEIMQRLTSLFEEVKTLRSIVDIDFQSIKAEILSENPNLKAVIIQDCNRKEAALSKALSNSDVYDAFINYQIAKAKKEPGLVR